MAMVLNGYVKALAKSPPTDVDIFSIMQWLDNLIRAVVDEPTRAVVPPDSDPTDPDNTAVAVPETDESLNCEEVSA